MWDSISNLTTLATAIQWISIIMIFIGGLLQIGKLFVDNRIKDLKDQNEQVKEETRKEKEEKLYGQIDSLTKNLSSSKEEIEELRKKTKFVDPYTQPLQSGFATITVNVQSKNNINAHYMDRGGYVIFGKGNEDLILMSDNECDGRTIKEGINMYRGVFQLDVNHRNIGKNLTFIKEADYIQIKIFPITDNSIVEEGRVIFTFNGNARMEFDVPNQKMKNDLIFISNLSSTFAKVFK